MSQGNVSRKRRKARPWAKPVAQRGQDPFGEEPLAGESPPAAKRKRTPEERREARAADKAAAAAHRRAAVRATAGGPIAPNLGFDDEDPSPPLTRAQRTEAKNQAVRDSLEPLGQGERPVWVTAAAVLAAGLGLLNIVLYAAGVRVEHATIGATLLIGAILIACGVGMWRAYYEAVLAFEILLGVTLTFATISLIAVDSWGGLLRSLIFVIVPGTFFWKLIRAMARLQMPSRPGEPPRRR